MRGRPRCHAVHLFPEEQRAVVTYDAPTSVRGRRQLRSILVVHRAFETLVQLLPFGMAALVQWLEAMLKPPEDGSLGLEQRARARALAHRIMEQMLGATERDGGTKGVGAPPPAFRRLDPRLATVLSSLEQEYEQKISLKSAAKLMHLSPGRFRQVFKKATGKTFKQFLTELRVQIAAALLTEEPLEQVIAIANRTGPWQLCAFGRAFKKHFGCTPRQYRRRCQSAKEL
jgi:AraC-like DNA-binding protein